jgi:hypothetical protein
MVNIDGATLSTYILPINNTINGTYNYNVTNSIETYTSNSIQIKFLKINNIQLSSGTLSNLYNPNILTYSASVEYAISSIIITITKNNQDAIIKINNVVLVSNTINLNVGNNIINITVSVDNEPDENYTINITRNQLIKSSDAKLKSIKLSTGKLIPNFKSTITQYKVNVKSSVRTFYVIPTKNNQYASIKVNNKTVISGKKSNTFSLRTGNNIITIVVTAQNGTKKTYRLTIIRSRNILFIKNNIMKNNIMKNNIMKNNIMKNNIMKNNIMKNNIIINNMRIRKIFK